VLGFLFLGFAGIGVVVPGMPVTIFCILALWAFKKSSPKMEAWLLNHKVVGPTLRDWEETKSIKARTKWIAVSTLWATLIVSAFFVKSTKGYIILGLVGVLVSAYILTRKTKLEQRSSISPVTTTLP
jgi:uncharacterized membrane protein YbaN (DUF454 family)